MVGKRVKKLPHTVARFGTAAFGTYLKLTHGKHMGAGGAGRMENNMETFPTPTKRKLRLNPTTRTRETELRRGRDSRSKQWATRTGNQPRAFKWADILCPRGCPTHCGRTVLEGRNSGTKVEFWGWLKNLIDILMTTG